MSGFRNKVPIFYFGFLILLLPYLRENLKIRVQGVKSTNQEYIFNIIRSYYSINQLKLFKLSNY